MLKETQGDFGKRAPRERGEVSEACLLAKSKGSNVAISAKSL